MKKLIKSVFVVALALSLSACSANAEKKSGLDKVKEKGVLVVAMSPDFAPAEFLIEGSNDPVGIDVELGKYIAEKLGVEVQFSKMDFTAVLTAVSTGSADIAISGFGYKEDRDEAFELSHGYNKSGKAACHGLIVQAKDAANYKSLDDFSGKTILAQNGSLQQGYAEAQIPNAKIEPIADLTMGIMQLEAGKADAMASVCSLGKAYAANSDKLEFSEVTFVVEKSDVHDGNVVAVAKGETEFIEAVNAIIDEVNDLGLCDEWSKKAKEIAKENGIELPDEDE